MDIKIVRFVWLQTTEHIFRKRWLIPFLIALLIGVSATNDLLVKSSVRGVSYNTWDTLFSAFSNPNIFFFVLNILFLFLVFDLTDESAFDQSLLVILGSRSHWWVGKVILLAISVLVYTFLNLAVVAGVTSFTFPWDNSWSTGARLDPGSVYLTQRLLDTQLFIVFIKMIILLGLGWFGLGLLVLAVSILSNRCIVGFFAGVLLNFSGLIIYKDSVSNWVFNLSFHQQMFLVLQYINQENPLPFNSFIFSILYWMCWILIFLITGYLLGKRRDFFERRPSG